MASFQNAFICAGLAAALWTCVGLSLSSRLMPRSMVWPAAPVLGWAVHSAVVFPIFCIVGMAKVTVIAVTVATLFAALIALSRIVYPIKRNADTLPLWAIGAALVLSTAIMALVLPQITSGGVNLAVVIFDHSKVAMIDEIARLGVPAGNPFFGESDGLNRLVYYYLWHFSAAELAVLTGFSGWEADAGMTWFTAFSSLTLMMGFAKLLSARRASAAWVVVLAAALSIRPNLSMLFGSEITYAVTGWPGGFGPWLFQVTWAPQHVASAGCVLIAVFLLVELSKRRSRLMTIVFSLIVAAGFESSTWVGGITFPLAAAAVSSLILLRIEPSARIHFALSAIGAAVLAIAISSPFIYDQFNASELRAKSFPIGVLPYYVLGDEIPERVRTFLDIPAYWTAFLFTEFAAFYPAGIIMVVLLLRDRWFPLVRKMYVAPLGILAIVGLTVGSLLMSRVGGNNDLAWRGVLPAIFVLIICTATGLSRYLRSMPPAYVLSTLAIIGIASFDGVWSLYDNIRMQYKQPSALFAGSVGMWEAVREHSKKDERIANNPLFLSDMTPWPINLSWALLSNRRSCYAGSGYGPFAPRTTMSLDDIESQFSRVFSGYPEADDLEQFANRYNCGVVVVTSQDGAWVRDPFLSSPLYDLVDSKFDAWRIYKRHSSYKE